MSCKNILIMILIAVFVFLAQQTSADLKIVQKTRLLKAAAGEPEENYTETIYITSEWIRMDKKNNITFLFDGESGKMYLLNNYQKTYCITDSAQLKLLGRDLASDLGKIEVKVVNTGDMEKIGQWQTGVWELSAESDVFRFDSAIYMTTEFELPAFFKDFHRNWRILAVLPEKFVEEFCKLEGFPVKVIAKFSLSGQEGGWTEEVIEISKDDLQQSLFQIPSDFMEEAFSIRWLE